MARGLKAGSFKNRLRQLLVCDSQIAARKNGNHVAKVRGWWPLAASQNLVILCLT